MAFNGNQFTITAQGMGFGAKVYDYFSTDANNTVDTAGYFNAAYAYGLRVNDSIRYTKTDTFTMAIATCNQASAVSVDMGDFTTVGAHDVDGFLNSAAFGDDIFDDQALLAGRDPEAATEDELALLLLNVDEAKPKLAGDFLADNQSSHRR